MLDPEFTLPVEGQIEGRKSKKGGSDDDAANSLISKATGRIVVALSEGVIEGLVDGAKSIYRDQTPLRNKGGNYTVENVKFQQNKGFADDEHFNGHDDVGAVYNVDTVVSKSGGPIQRTIIEEEADAVRVIDEVYA